MSDESRTSAGDVQENPWEPAEADRAALSPHRVGDRSEDGGDAEGDVGPGWLTPSASEAADQPHTVKSQERQNFAESRMAQRVEKPKNPAKLTKASWGYALKRTPAEFAKDQCTDLAAALTYYAVLAVFPALIALVSILSLVGEAQDVQDFFLDTLDNLLDPEMIEGARTVLDNITSAGGAGIALAIGILTALWTASNYVNA
ncbi:MAG: YhjD/YihY/BrkB family envelope integrity protein, partial [Brachybacterium sp.]|nr:YhjD/YihY/BrkB family envelope integrity protein [Brachybacterium sp.]